MDEHAKEHGYMTVIDLTTVEKADPQTEDVGAQ